MAQLAAAGPTPSNVLESTPSSVSHSSITEIAPRHAGFPLIVVLAGAPDQSIHNSNVLLTHEFDRNDTLANVTSVLRQFQRTSALFASPDSDSTPKELDAMIDQSVMVERVALKAWPDVLARLIDTRKSLPRAESHLQTPNMLVFNLCDGCDELDGYPGGSVPRDLEANGFAFTGSMSEFYRITTPKTLLKSYLQRHMVPTSDFVPIRPDSVESDVDTAIARLGFPLIVKPSISYASLGITSASVTHSRAATLTQIASILSEFPLAGVFVERFLAGREFTAVVTGDAAAAANVHVYPVAERAFRNDLKVCDRFLAFDRYWAGWTIEGDRPPADTPAYYTYRLAPDAWQDKLMRIAKDAYIACKGSGYGRVDLRTVNMEDCEAYVLEVNANCGLTFDETSSLGEILRLSQVAPLTFLQEIIQGAVVRWSCAATASSHPSSIQDGTLTEGNMDLAPMFDDEPSMPLPEKRADSVLGSRQTVSGTNDGSVEEPPQVMDSARWQGAGV